MSPITRADQLPPRDRQTASIEPLALGDDWTEPFELWGARKVSLYAGANAVAAQLSRSQPPEPPTWDDPIPIPVGPWSHVGPFGYIRFKNLLPGQTATVYGALYAE